MPRHTREEADKKTKSSPDRIFLEEMFQAGCAYWSIIHENPESAEVSSEFWMQSILTSILKGFLKEHLLWTCWCRFLVQDEVSFPLLSCSWQEEQSERKNAGAGSEYWSAHESRVEAVIFLKDVGTDAVNQTAWD